MTIRKRRMNGVTLKRDKNATLVTKSFNLSKDILLDILSSVKLFYQNFC